MLLFAGGWLLLKPNGSSDMLWNEIAQVWTEIPDRKSEAMTWSGKQALQKMKVADDICLHMYDFDV